MRDPFLMVVLIVAIVMFANVMRARYGHRRHREEAAEAPETMRLREEVAQLKDRLAVLERITIEKENSLEREIERLRDR
jgi:hypothetical protein